MVTTSPSSAADIGQDAHAQALVAVARAAIAAALTGGDYQVPRLAAPFDGPGNVFVTLRSPEGALRGCVGRTGV